MRINWSSIEIAMLSRPSRDDYKWNTPLHVCDIAFQINQTLRHNSKVLTNFAPSLSSTHPTTPNRGTSIKRYQSTTLIAAIVVALAFVYVQAASTGEAVGEERRLTMVSPLIRGLLGSETVDEIDAVAD